MSNVTEKLKIIKIYHTNNIKIIQTFSVDYELLMWNINMFRNM